MTNIGDIDLNNIVPPSSVEALPGFEPGNLICAGTGGEIIGSRRCTIINGIDNRIYQAYNHNAIGISNAGYYDASNIFFVRCSNGIICTGDVVAFARSDERLKENITILSNASKVISKINPIKFKWNSKQNRYTGSDIGLSAQNIQDHLPIAVVNRKDKYKAVNYLKIIPILVASIQEKQKRINRLKQKIKEIKNGNK